MTTSSFRARFARLGPTQVVDRVSSGSPAVVALRPGVNLEAVLTISAILSLVKRHATTKEAKLAVEEALETGRAVLALPMLESVSALASEIEAAGMEMIVLVPEEAM